MRILLPGDDGFDDPSLGDVPAQSIDNDGDPSRLWRTAHPVSTLTALPDRAIGPQCVPGVPAVVHATVTRVTAPNPSMMTGPGTNTYVVGDDAVVVIDPGPPIASHLDVVRSVVAGRRVTAVAVTHHHRDHAPAARSLADSLGAPVVGHGHALLSVDVAATEGSELVAGTFGLVAWHTPGHASDHLCYFAPSTGWLFTGDHLMQGSTVVIRPPDGDLTAYLVRGRPGPRRPAGAAPRAGPRPGARLARRMRPPRSSRTARPRAEVVLEALRAPRPRDTGRAARAFAYRDVGPERDEVATATCWAHLLALVDDGRATSAAARYDPDAVFVDRLGGLRARRADGALDGVEQPRRAALRARRRGEVVDDPAGEVAEDRPGGAVGQRDRAALVGLGAEGGVERHRRQELDAELVGESRAAARAEQLVARAVLADERAHVLDHPEHAGGSRAARGRRRARRRAGRRAAGS